MGGRYWITGVQLGIIRSLLKTEKDIEFIDLILDSQYIAEREEFEKMMKSKKED